MRLTPIYSPLLLRARELGNQTSKIGFWFALAMLGRDWYLHQPIGDDIQFLMFWVVLIRLDRLIDAPRVVVIEKKS